MMAAITLHTTKMAERKESMQKNLDYASQLAPYFYTSPASVSTIIDSFVVKNNSAFAQTISIWIVPIGQNADSTNIVINNQGVIPGGVPIIMGGIQTQILGAGAFIVIQSNINGAILCSMGGRQLSS